MTTRRKHVVLALGIIFAFFQLIVWAAPKSESWGLRHRNRLLQSSTTNSIVPTTEPSLCTGSACCQADGYTSPYRLQLENTTTSQVTTNTFTTFHFHLIALSTCDESSDINGCCTASGTDLYINIDPALKVVQTAVDFQPYNALTDQSQFGLHLTSLGVTIADLAEGAYIPIDVTVEGEASYPCPPPESAPVPGLCNVIIVGGSVAAPSSCCPSSISLPPSAGPSNTVQQSFVCNSNLDQSGFQMAITSVSQPYLVSGSLVADYNFLLGAPASCNSNGINTCCAMDLEYLLLKVSATANVSSVRINGVSTAFSESSYNWDGTASDAYNSLLLNNVNLDSSDAASGMELGVTVQLPADSTQVPQLCLSEGDVTGNSVFGSCDYILFSSSGMCCPTGTTASLPLGVSSSPPSSSSQCSPSSQVTYDSSGLEFQYSQMVSAASSTSFLFTITEQSSDLCSWSLFITQFAAARLAATLESAPASSIPSYLITNTASGAILTWTYGPSSMSSMTYNLTVLGGISLSQLCMTSTVSGQQSTCAAVLRTTSVFTQVFFSEGDALSVLAPLPIAGLCSSSLSLSESCVTIAFAAYNSDNTVSIYDFVVANQTCDTVPTTISVFLTPIIASELSASLGSILPQSIASVNSASGALTWQLTSATSHYGFELNGINLPPSVCMQNIFPNQPSGSCVIEFNSSTSCFRGLVTPNLNSSLSWVQLSPAGASGGLSVGGIVAIAIIVPCVVVAIVASGVWYWRKSRRSWSDDDLSFQLRSESSLLTSTTLTENPLMGVVDHRDLSIRVRPSSGGGARPE